VVGVFETVGCLDRLRVQLRLRSRSVRDRCTRVGAGLDLLLEVSRWARGNDSGRLEGDDVLRRFAWLRRRRMGDPGRLDGVRLRREGKHHVLHGPFLHAGREEWRRMNLLDGLIGRRRNKCRVGRDKIRGRGSTFHLSRVEGRSDGRRAKRRVVWKGE
jgi:hypothetical protein